jgi:hypothetical protein
MIMKVNGTYITEAQTKAMIDAMGSHFRSSDIYAAAMKAGTADESIAKRAADRLIQKRRRDGWIFKKDSGLGWTNRY